MSVLESDECADQKVRKQCWEDMSHGKAMRHMCKKDRNRKHREPL
jgi:siroheme synthase (precorrin-2 oxidase/ferrochelatase)